MFSLTFLSKDVRTHSPISSYAHAKKRYDSPAPGGPDDENRVVKSLSSSAGTLAFSSKTADYNHKDNSFSKTQAPNSKTADYRGNSSPRRLGVKHPEEETVHCQTSSPVNNGGSNEHKELFKSKMLPRNTSLMQQEKVSGSQTKKNVTMDTGSFSSPTPLDGANFSHPPPPIAFTGFDSSMPLQTLENGVPSTWNISKTVNYTYQTTYTPRLHSPHPVYSQPQYNGNTHHYGHFSLTQPVWQYQHASHSNKVSHQVIVSSVLVHCG